MSDTVTGAVHTAGWLIEEVGAGLHWIALSTDVWPLLRIRRTLALRDDDKIEQYQTPIRRVKDASEALRFARREDAEAFAALFSRFLLHPRVTEHEWPTVSAAEGDLLGKLIEALEKLSNRTLEYIGEFDGTFDHELECDVEMRTLALDAKAILLKAQAREVTR
jgi:hypothetical protein